ncbi:MAG: FAD/NAD(P)-binding oxidoreductase [Alkaliphilus sp.]|nr:NAD(P)/FAD-dependent oxidoreductase [bacterium AH-315-L21]MBN4056641.1 NAD(P)/FAD-dependent oxidoreductase [bacterium AH-315-K05]MBN4062882.1 NAD(P)/FAD-dependent oxidoreductase [Alkaliphilus sp. AH-315-G20]PHS29841.1 MAG: FAD/NAD(P)-binding oxidoreductase [Alkaliphilus sp.]
MKKRREKIQKELQNSVSKTIECNEWRSSIILEGTVDCWDDVVNAGKVAANKGYKGVVNRIEVKNLKIPKISQPLISDNSLDKTSTDVLIIGGGIIGCAIARELAKWDISILLVDKEDDLAMHTSSRNNGIIHPGLAASPKSKKAYYNVKGNAIYTKVTKELGVAFKRSGSYVLFEKKWMQFALPLIKRRAKQNKIEGAFYVSKKELREKEPCLDPSIEGALYFPSTATLSPYKMTIAYAENAIANGVVLSLNTIVLGMKNEKEEVVSVKTNRGTIYPKVVINAAGVYADKIADMADDQFFTIHPRKGEVALMDKKAGYLLNSIVGKFNLGHSKCITKGGGLVKTIEGNILIGPNAYEQPYREDFTTDRESFEMMVDKLIKTIPKLSHSNIITYMAGIRAATYEEDFIIEKSEYVKNLVHVAGIQSPGLASAPAIAEEIEKLALKSLSTRKAVKRKANWNPKREKDRQLNITSLEERKTVVYNNSDYGEIVCRCEEVSKGEVIDAINATISAKTIDAIKRRTRAGAGRCQGGFCTPIVMKIIEENTDLKMTEITKKGKNSIILKKETK